MNPLIHICALGTSNLIKEGNRSKIYKSIFIEVVFWDKNS